MTLSEILLSIVAAAATLTPLILGLLKYFGDKKAGPEPVEPAAPGVAIPAVVLGDTIDFESVAVKALRDHIDLLTESHHDMKHRLELSEAALNQCRALLRAAGIQAP